MSNTTNEKANANTQRANIASFAQEVNDKKPLISNAEKVLKETGTLGRVRDKVRNTAWRRLLGFSRDKAECSDSTIKAYLENQFELCLAQAILNSQREAQEKGFEYSVIGVEGILLYLGTRTAAIKAFSETEEEEEEGI